MRKINYLFFFVFLIIISCRDRSELTMERGIYFFKLGNFIQAMQEFNGVIYNLSQNNTLPSGDRILLARAHYNLGLSYSKLEEYHK